MLKKIETFRRYQSVILPDFSVYRDFPLAMQIFQKMLETIEPETVLCYGNLSDAMKYECKRRLVNVKEYGTEISKRMKLRTDLQRKLF